MSVNMSTATIALRTRPRPSLGPALGRSRLPFGTILFSAVLHVVALGALGLAAVSWRDAQPKTYVVNLVPAIAAVGRPHGQASAPPALPPRTSEATPAPTKSTPTELPHREARTAPPEMPARSTSRETATLPDRALPQRRPAALPRPGDKELPASALPRASTEPSARRESPAATPPPPPAAPLGQAAGSIHGAGTVTLSATDFPYAWYIRAITRKIEEQWEGRAINGRQPEVEFTISLDGQLRAVEISKTSGNPAYDQLAMRAIRDANPFPPLPPGFGKPTLKVGLQFVYDPRAR